MCFCWHIVGLDYLILVYVSFLNSIGSLWLWRGLMYSFHGNADSHIDLFHIVHRLACFFCVFVDFFSHRPSSSHALAGRLPQMTCFYWALDYILVCLHFLVMISGNLQQVMFVVKLIELYVIAVFFENGCHASVVCGFMIDWVNQSINFIL